MNLWQSTAQLVSDFFLEEMGLFRHFSSGFQQIKAFSDRRQSFHYIASADSARCLFWGQRQLLPPSVKSWLSSQLTGLFSRKLRGVGGLMLLGERLLRQV